MRKLEKMEPYFDEDFEEEVTSEHTWVEGDDEFDSIDDVIAALGEVIMEEEKMPHIIIPKRMKEVVDAGAELQKLFAGEDVKVGVTLNEPFKSVGDVSVMGKKIVIRDTKKFAEAVSTANNIEMYPQLDGVSVMALGYNGLTAILREE